MKYCMTQNLKVCLWYAQKLLISHYNNVKIHCSLAFYLVSQPQNVLKMFLSFHEIEPSVHINVFLYKRKTSVACSAHNS